MSHACSGDSSGHSREGLWVLWIGPDGAESCVCLVRGWEAAAEVGDSKKKKPIYAQVNGVASMEKKRAPADQDLVK